MANTYVIVVSCDNVGSKNIYTTKCQVSPFKKIQVSNTLQLTSFDNISSIENFL